MPHDMPGLNLEWRLSALRNHGSTAVSVPAWDGLRVLYSGRAFAAKDLSTPERARSFVDFRNTCRRVSREKPDVLGSLLQGVMGHRIVRSMSFHDTDGLLSRKAQAGLVHDKLWLTDPKWMDDDAEARQQAVSDLENGILAPLVAMLESIEDTVGNVSDEQALLKDLKDLQKAASRTRSVLLSEAAVGRDRLDCTEEGCRCELHVDIHRLLGGGVDRGEEGVCASVHPVTREIRIRNRGRTLSADRLDSEAVNAAEACADSQLRKALRLYGQGVRRSPAQISSLAEALGRLHQILSRVGR